MQESENKLTLPYGKQKEFKQKLSVIFREAGMTDWSGEVMRCFSHQIKHALIDVESKKDKEDVSEPEQMPMQKPDHMTSVDLTVLKLIMEFFIGPMMRDMQKARIKRRLSQ